MSTGYWIAIIIAVVALIIIAICAGVAFGKMKPTLNNLSKTSKKINEQVDHYNREVTVIQQKIGELNERVSLIQSNVDVDKGTIDELMNRSTELQDSLLYLKDFSSENGPDLAKESFEEAKTEGPKYFEMLKRTTQKTFRKQKNRYSH